MSWFNVPIFCEEFDRDQPMFRLGGEEFLVLLESTDLQVAADAAENLRRRVEEKSMVPGEKVSMSIGVAQWQQGERSLAWLQRADEALFSAKRAGRNRVCLAETG